MKVIALFWFNSTLCSNSSCVNSQSDFYERKSCCFVWQSWTCIHDSGVEQGKILNLSMTFHYLLKSDWVYLSFSSFQVFSDGMLLGIISRWQTQIYSSDHHFEWFPPSAWYLHLKWQKNTNLSEYHYAVCITLYL